MSDCAIYSYPYFILISFVLTVFPILRSDVSQDAVGYSDDIEVMEEAGTPGILQDIRCGLAFRIKDELVGAHRIEVRR